LATFVNCGRKKFYNIDIRVEEMPRFARAKNVFGKWVYLVEAASKLRQHVQVSSIRPGVNFTNILLAAFFTKVFLRTFYVLTTWVCKFLAKGFWRKSCL
jgi:hypothetical protein